MLVNNPHGCQNLLNDLTEQSYLCREDKVSQYVSLTRYVFREHILPIHFLALCVCVSLSLFVLTAIFQVNLG